LGKIIVEVYSNEDTEKLKSSLLKKGMKIGADGLVLIQQTYGTEYVIIPNPRYTMSSRPTTPFKKMILTFLAVRYKR